MTEDNKAAASDEGVKEATKGSDEEHSPEEPEEPEEKEDGEDGIVVTDDDEQEDLEFQDPLGQIEALEKKLKTTHERLLRTAADLDNLRRRSRREIEEAVPRGHFEVLAEILPVIDSIDLALASANPEGSAAGIIEGVKMIKKQFMSAAERFQLKPIESLGQIFDPNYHEAVAQIDTEEYPAGYVVEEMRKGYMLGDRLLRAAMVVVSRRKTEPPASPVQEEAEEDEGVEEDAVEEDAVEEQEKEADEALASEREEGDLEEAPVEEEERDLEEPSDGEEEEDPEEAKDVELAEAETREDMDE